MARFLSSLASELKYQCSWMLFKHPIATLATWLCYFLFYYQPGVDRAQLVSDWATVYGPKPFLLVATVTAYAGSSFLAVGSHFFMYWLRLPFFEQYRIQSVWVWELDSSSPKREHSLKLIRDALKKGLTDAVFVNILAFGAFLWYKFSFWTDEELMSYLRTTPEWGSTALKLCVGFTIFETIFYWGHRKQHELPYMYKYHKIHHQFKQPVAITGIWGELYEGLLTFFLPGVVPMMLLDMHVYEFWMWTMAHVFHSSYDHCGYDFPFSPFQLIPLSGFAAEHNFHHSHIQGMYGLYFPWFWDALCGTDEHWQKFRRLKAPQEDIARSVNQLMEEDMQSPKFE